MTTCPAFLAVQVQEGPLRWASLPQPWLLTLLVVVGFLGARALYKRERGRAGTKQRLLLALLRTLALLAVFLVLAGPFRERTTTAQEQAHLVLLLDSSHSMSTQDVYAPEEAARLRSMAGVGGSGSELDLSRGALMKRLLAGEQGALLRRLDERFVLHAFAFDADLRSLGTTAPRKGRRGEDADQAEVDPVQELVAAVEGLPLDGKRTRLGGVLRRVASEFGRRQDQDLAGVVLISDGRDTSEGEPPLEALAALGDAQEALRVIAVGMGNPASGKNLWVDRVRANEVVLVRDEVLFESGVRHTGFAGRPVEVTMEIVQVADADGRPIEARPYTIRRGREGDLRQRIDALPEEGDETATVRVRLPFDQAGTFQVRVRARLEDPVDQKDDAVPDDDVRVHEIRVKDERIRVLYVENQPRHDWRFLSSYLTREPNMKLARGREEARSRFEVHVLLQSADNAYRQPSSYGEPALKRFPRTRKELFAYDVLLLGDIDWTRLDPAGRAASERLLPHIVDFVEEGGGLVLQSGVDYRNPLELADTPLRQLLPINATPGDRKASEQYQRQFRIRLTDAGAASPIFAVVPTERGGVPSPAEVATMWAGERPISQEWHWWWMYRATEGLRPSATALARVEAGGGEEFLDRRGEPLPVFASMPFGKGRVFWSALDNTARLRRGLRDAVFGPFWEQILRDLATYRLLVGNRRYKIFPDKDEYFVGETATVLIRALDASFEPLTDPLLDGVHVEHVGDEPAEGSTLLIDDERPRSLQAEGSPGTYRLLVPLTRQGTMRITIDREEEAGGRRSIERAERRFAVHYRAREDVLKVPDHDTLADIARATHPSGTETRVLRPYELEDALDDIATQPRARILDRQEITLWDRWWVLLAIVLLLAIEWALRKRWQMV